MLTKPFRFATSLVAMALLVACATSPLGMAESPAQAGYAILGEYNVLLDPIVDAIEDESVPLDLREELIALTEGTAPTIASLEETLIDYTRARRAWETSNTATAARQLDVVTSNLDQWILEAARLVDRMGELLERL